MNSLGRLLLPALLVMGLISACGVFGGASDCPPSWYLKRPSEATWALGIGHCGRTYLPQDARDLALARAVNELAAQAGVAIESESLLLQKLRGESYVEEWTQQINARVEGIIRGFEIVEQHQCVDDGNHRFPAGSAFVLLRIRRSELDLEPL